MSGPCITDVGEQKGPVYAHQALTSASMNGAW